MFLDEKCYEPTKTPNIVIQPTAKKSLINLTDILLL